MKKQPDTKQVAKDWLLKSNRDLKASELLQSHPDQLYDVACFHAQQSVEKAIKALLVFRKIDFPKVHDLTELVTILPDIDKKEFNLDELAGLNPSAIASRYPGEWEPETLQDVKEAILIARKIFSFVQSEINN